MSEGSAFEHRPHAPAETVSSASQPPALPRSSWTGPTYYGRPQLKAAPFNKVVVGTYIFLAGLSGASAVLAAIADRAHGRSARGVMRRGRYLSLLTMTLGPLLLIFDLHTPKRFYNMLRIAKGTSPMSIGTWMLMAFSGFAGLSAVAQFISDHVPLLGRLRGLARRSQIPAAVAGAGLATYTASLLSATSTPAWAAAPNALAARFGASSMASAASALSLGETSGQMRRTLETVACMALVVEAIATDVSAKARRDRGVATVSKDFWGTVEHVGAIDLGVVLPLGLYAASRVLRGNSSLSDAASLAVLAGSLMLRISTLGVGADSASRPEVSLRFSERRLAGRIRGKRRRASALDYKNG
jgi:protein NrfD